MSNTYNSLINSLYTKTTGGASRIDVSASGGLSSDLKKYLNSLAASESGGAVTPVKNNGGSIDEILSGGDQDVLEMKASIANMATQQYIQLIYDVYMGSDISFRLGDVNGNLAFDDEGKVINNEILEKSYAQYDVNGNIDTTSNLRINFRLDNLNSGFARAEEKYVNAFFPPYTNTNLVGHSSDTLDVNNMVATVKDLATFRTPGFKQINDNISLLQYLYEQTTGVVSTYLTDWDVSLYLQEGLIPNDDDNTSKVITIMNRITQDNPAGYTDSKACVFGQLGAAVSKYSPDGVAYNEKAWDPSNYPLSKYWDRYETREYEDNLDRAYHIGRRGIFSNELSDDFDSGSTFFDLSTADKVKWYDWIGMAYSGWRHAWQDMRNYQTLYTNPLDGIEEIDAIQANQSGKNTLTSVITEICDKLADMDVTVGYKMPFYCNKVSGAIYEGKIVDTYDYYLTSPSTRRGIFVMRVVSKFRKDKPPKVIKYLDEEGDPWNGTSNCEILQWANKKGLGALFKKYNLSRKIYLLRAHIQARVLYQFISRWKTIDNMQNPTVPPRYAYEDKEVKVPQKISKDAVAVGTNKAFADSTGISLLAPAIYGGPHGDSKSPNTLQGFFQVNNSHLRGLPRIDDVNKAFEGVDFWYQNFDEAIGDTPSNFFSYRCPGKLIRSLKDGIYNDSYSWPAPVKNKRISISVSNRNDWIKKVTKLKLELKWLKFPLKFETSLEWKSKTGKLAVSECQYLLGEYAYDKATGMYTSADFEFANATPPESGNKFDILVSYQPAPTLIPYKEPKLNASWTINEKTIYTYNAAYELNVNAPGSSSTSQQAGVTSLTQSPLANANTLSVLTKHTTSEIDFGDEVNNIIVRDIIKANGTLESQTKNSKYIDLCLVQKEPNYLFYKCPIRVHAAPYLVAYTKEHKFLWWKWYTTEYKQKYDKYLEADVKFSESENYTKIPFVISGTNPSLSAIPGYADSIGNTDLPDEEFMDSYSLRSLHATPYTNTVEEIEIEDEDDNEEGGDSINTSVETHAAGVGYLPFMGLSSDCFDKTIKEMVEGWGVTGDYLKVIVSAFTSSTLYRSGSTKATITPDSEAMRRLMQTIIRQRNYLAIAKQFFLDNVDFHTLDNIIRNNVDPNILKYTLRYSKDRNPASTHYRFFIDKAWEIATSADGHATYENYWNKVIEEFDDVISMFTGRKEITCNELDRTFKVTYNYSNNQDVNLSDITVAQLICFNEVVKKAKELIAKNSYMEKITEYMACYLNVLYEYRKYFISKRCNKQDGTLFQVRHFESAVPLILANDTATWVGGDGTTFDGDASSKAQKVYSLDKNNTNSAKFLAYKEGAESLERDRVSAVFIKVKYVPNDQEEEIISEYLDAFRRNKYVLFNDRPNYAFNLNKGRWMLLPINGVYELHSDAYDKAFTKFKKNEEVPNIWLNADDTFATISQNINWSKEVQFALTSDFKKSYPSIWNKYSEFTGRIPIVGSGIKDPENGYVSKNGIYSVYDETLSKDVCIFASKNPDIDAETLLKVAADAGDSSEASPASLLCSSNKGGLDLWRVALGVQPLADCYKKNSYLIKEESYSDTNTPATTTLGGVFSYNLYPIMQDQASAIAGIGLDLSQQVKNALGEQ